MQFKEITSEAEFKELIDVYNASSCEYVALDSETTGLSRFSDKLISISITSQNSNEAFFVSREYIKPLRDLKKPLVLHNFKFDFHMLASAGIDCRDIHLYLDTLILDHLLDENNPHGLGDIIQRRYQDDYKARFWEKYPDYNAAPKDAQIEYACKDVLYTDRVCRDTLRDLSAAGRPKSLIDHVHRLALALYDTEAEGIKIDLPYVAKVGEDLTQKISTLKSEIRGIVDLDCQLVENDLYEKELDKRSTPKGKLGVKRPSFSFDSPSQLGSLLYDYLRLPVQLSKKRSRTVDDAALEVIQDEHPVIPLLREYRGHQKVFTAFIEGTLEKVHKGRIYPSFNVCGTVTGRLSHCIAEGQLVSVVGGQKPIEQVVPGDLVYCYDDLGKLKISKVLKRYDNGEKECVEVKWQSSGCGKTGTLICTPDHRLKHKYEGWVQAKDLKRGDKIFHLRRALQVNGRIRLYGTNSYMELEEACIKREYFKGTSEDHIHHINEVKSDNRVDNLVVLSDTEHTKLHSNKNREKIRAHLSRFWGKAAHNPTYLDENPNWIHTTKFQLLRMISKARGRPTYVPMDFETFKKKCRLLGVDLKSLCSRYSHKGLYRSRALVMKALEGGGVVQASELLHTDVRGLKKLCQDYGLTYNHQILSVKPKGVYRVYDLEVEGFHNFIVNELCVHNSNPNLAQLPSSGGVRGIYVPKEGYKFISADYKQLEVTLAAHFSRDPALLSIVYEGASQHDITAAGLGISRSLAKTINFGMLYGAGPSKIASVLGCSAADAERTYSKYWETYPGVRDFNRRCHDKIDRGEPIITPFGRARHFPRTYENKWDKERAKRQAPNALIQSTGADCTNWAYYTINDTLLAKGFGKALFTVHDEVIIEVLDNKVDESREILKTVMESVAKLISLSVPLTVDVSEGMSRWLD